MIRPQAAWCGHAASSTAAVLLAAMRSKVGSEFEI